jgi:hypothetical protein
MLKLRASHAAGPSGYAFWRPHKNGRDCPRRKNGRPDVMRATNEGKCSGCLLAGKAIGAHPQLGQISEVVFV